MKQKRGRRWTEEDVRSIYCNPVYAGIGPYPALTESDEFWMRLIHRAVEDEGVEATLNRLRHYTLCSFVRLVRTVASPTFVQDGAKRVALVGLDAYLRTLLADLRAELRDVPADEAAPLFGYMRAPAE